MAKTSGLFRLVRNERLGGFSHTHTLSFRATREIPIFMGSLGKLEMTLSTRALSQPFFVKASAVAENGAGLHSFAIVNGWRNDPDTNPDSHRDASGAGAKPARKEWTERDR